jgi:hypothetical protein
MVLSVGGASRAARSASQIVYNQNANKSGRRLIDEGAVS